jgi:hypothetical protein
MAKKDISKTLLTGTTKQRLLLIAEDSAREFCGGDRLLSDAERNKLYSTFKKPNEIKLWNSYKKYSESVSNGIMNLQGMKYDVLLSRSTLRGYILLWNSIENAEVLVNSVLDEVKDEEERIKIASKCKDIGTFIFTTPIVDKEGYLDISVDFDKGTEEETALTINLITVIKKAKDRLTASAIKYISWEKGLLDFMEDKGYNVKTYKDKILDMTQDVYKPSIQWGKYRGLSAFSSPEDYDNLLKKYNVDLDMIDIKPDEEQVKFFRYEIIGDNE